MNEWMYEWRAGQGWGEQLGHFPLLGPMKSSELGEAQCSQVPRSQGGRVRSSQQQGPSHWSSEDVYSLPGKSHCLVLSPCQGSRDQALGPSGQGRLSAPHTLGNCPRRFQGGDLWDERMCGRKWQWWLRVTQPGACQGPAERPAVCGLGSPSSSSLGAGASPPFPRACLSAGFVPRVLESNGKEGAQQVPGQSLGKEQGRTWEQEGEGLSCCPTHTEDPEASSCLPQKPISSSIFMLQTGKPRPGGEATDQTQGANKAESGRGSKPPSRS